MSYVLINGWSANQELWAEFGQELCGEAGVDVIDLDGALSEEDWMRKIDDRVESGDVLLGWSLGGELAIRFAKRTEKSLKALCLLQTTPCFVQGDDWPEAMSLSAFQDFDALVSSGDMSRIKRQFAFMMTNGSAEAKLDRKWLKECYTVNETRTLR